MVRVLNSLKVGGAFIVVDKVVAPEGYLGTAFFRMMLAAKRRAGSSFKDITLKESSLAGIQRPLESSEIFRYPLKASEVTKGRGYIVNNFFKFGDFVGYIIYRNQ